MSTRNIHFSPSPTTDTPVEKHEPQTTRTARTRKNRPYTLSRFSRISRLKYRGHSLFRASLGLFSSVINASVVRTRGSRGLSWAAGARVSPSKTSAARRRRLQHRALPAPFVINSRFAVPVCTSVLIFLMRVSSLIISNRLPFARQRGMPPGPLSPFAEGRVCLQCRGALRKIQEASFEK